jgi:hypothetical protein
MLTLTACVTLFLPVQLAAAPVQADALPAGSDQQMVTLDAKTQPEVHRPTLDRLKQDAAAKGISLQEAIDTYIDDKARTDPAATANWPDGPVDIPDVMIDDLSAVSFEILEGLAETKKISLEESIDRYSFQHYADKVADQLKAEFGDQLSGFVHEDGGGAWIGFKGAIPEQAVQAARTLPGQVELRGDLGYIESDLPQVQASVDQELRRTPGVKEVTTWYDPKEGVGGFVVPSTNTRTAVTSQELSSVVSNLQAQSPAIKIDVKVLNEPIRTKPFDQYIRGGGNLGPEECTSNFNLISETGNTKRLGSAGHCAKRLIVTQYCNQSGDGDCTNISSKWSYVGNGGDIGMFDHGTLTATRTFYYDWGLKMYADGRSSGPSVGHAVCKFGFTTGKSCGKTTKLNVTSDSGVVGGLVTTDIPVGGTTCDHGDSGGPFYRDLSGDQGGEAYGVLFGQARDNTGQLRCAFTPVNRFYSGANYYVWTR